MAKRTLNSENIPIIIVPIGSISLLGFFQNSMIVIDRASKRRYIEILFWGGIFSSYYSIVFDR